MTRQIVVGLEFSRKRELVGGKRRKHRKLNWRTRRSSEEKEIEAKVDTLAAGWLDWGLPKRCSGKESACQSRICRFNPWVWKILWNRKWQPTPVFFVLKSPWTEEPGELQSMGSQRVGCSWTCTCTHMYWRRWLDWKLYVENQSKKGRIIAVIPVKKKHMELSY